MIDKFFLEGLSSLNSPGQSGASGSSCSHHKTVSRMGMVVVDYPGCKADRWMQGNDEELFIESFNSYQRAIQYQQLEKEQFQAQHPPGFFHSVLSRTCHSDTCALSRCCFVYIWQALTRSCLYMPCRGC